MSIIGKQISKEAINSRLLKNAAHFWGVKNINNLDPFVKLLMDALSNELFNTYHDIQNTESRMLERITRLLAPDIYVSPRPAHAIAYLRPSEAGCTLHAHSQIGFQKKVPIRENGLAYTDYPVVFTPVDTIPLRNGEVKYFATGSMLYGFDAQRNKVVQAITNTPLPYHTAWIGLTMDREEQLNDVPFYISFNPEVDDWLYVLLPATQWQTAHGQPLKIRSGLAYAADKRGNETDRDSVFSDYEIMKMLEEEVKTVYSKHFITVEDLGKVWESSDPYVIPDVLLERFEARELSPPGQSVIWVQIEFPTYFSREILNSLSFSLNASPS